MNDHEHRYERGCFDVLDILSSAWHGKSYYFMQDNGTIYSRDSGKYMSLDEAISEFASRIGDDGSI